VCAVGAGVSSLRVGDRVAVGGTGYANHAEVLWVPENLTVRIPDDVEYDEAAFATIASIPLHALRLSEAGVGDVVAVIGLGLIGQLALRLAIAGGCSVIGCDLYEERIELARRTGVPGATAEQFGELVHHLTGGAGADAVIVTAASPSSRPIRLAGEVSRDRARIVAVGAVQLDVPRELFYRKELSLTVSRSYGPGRYDRQYEEKGVDYPTPYVRWTEGRNLSAVVGLLASKRLRVRDLVSHRYPIAEADEAYQLLLQDRGGPIGVILEYPADVSREPVTSNVMAAGSPRVRHVQAPSDRIGIGLIGAGSFASNVLIPTLRRVGNVRFVSVASASGLSAYDAFRKYGFVRTANTAQDLIEDPEVDAVVIATTHDMHTPLVIDALNAGKPVFVEKPLAINWAQRDALLAAISPDAPLLVGFNRRFSPHVKIVQALLSARQGAAVVSIRVNGGTIPRESWVHDPDVGGGRLVGEACHFIDLCTALLSAQPRAIRATSVGTPDADAGLWENFVVTMDFPDGSIACVVYASKGDTRLGKERVELFCDGWSAIIDNFDSTIVFRDGRRRTYRAKAQKGHAEEIAGFVAAVGGGLAMPVSLNDLLMSTAATLAARDSALAGGEPVSLPR